MLPYCGLAHIYVKRKDYEKASRCFERLLIKTKVGDQYHGEYRIRKVLGLLCAKVPQSKYEIAISNLSETTKWYPNDEEARIGIALILQWSKLHASLDVYQRVIRLLKKKLNRKSHQKF